MTTRATQTSSSNVARAKAMAALAAWQRGEMAPAAVLALLLPTLRDAADYSNLGTVLRALGQQRDAEAAYRRAIALDPGFAAAPYNLGNLLADADRLAEAEAAYRAAIAARGDYAEAWNSLGTVLQRRGSLAAAAEAFRAASRHAPKWVDAHTNLGVALLGLEQYEAAGEAFRVALGINPKHANALGNFGALCLRAGAPVAAEATSRQAMALAPDEHRWVTNLAVALQLQGRHAETEQYCRQALAQRPDYVSGHGNLLFALNYRDDLSGEEIFAEYQRWDAQHARKLAPAAPRFDIDATLGRRLRVGYVSPDFRTHAVALFSEPLLAAHDRSQIELTCYAEVAVEDATTARFRALADHWRSTIGRSDEDVAEMIRQDRIDVLVDMAGHSAGNRLLVFARQPAPVQIAYLIGHGTTSGLAAMDAFLADDALAPPGAEAVFSEKLVRLPRIPLAYQPPAEMPPVAPLPATANRCVTFGHFGRPERLNAQVVAAWSRILHAVPGSRLVLNNRNFQEAAFRRLFLERFAAHDIPPERLELLHTAPQPTTWAAYGTIDIALDPFPHNAGTTTIEALWQGVPVVTLAGRPTVGRFGASILHALELDDWVTTDVDAYVERAIAAARDPGGLAALRAALRPRFAASPLHDATGLARALEAAYRTLWAAKTETAEARLRRLFGSGERARARALAETILASEPTNAVASHVAGLIAYHEQRLVDADRHLSVAIATLPNDAEQYANHAAILRTLGRLPEAEAAARAALALAPDRVETNNNLGNILRDAARYDESVACYQAALRLAPRFADGWANLAWVLSLAGRAREAEHAARQAIEHDPGNANGHNNLGGALMRQSRLREAESVLRDALALRPDFALPHSNLLFCLNYRDDMTPEEIYAEYQRWDATHARPLMPADPQFTLDRTPERRLRVGYVSPDFRTHAVALFAEPLLEAHDRDQVELFCYAEVPVEDDTTRRFRVLADHWRSTLGRTDADVAAMIRADRIDVLVDLAGHTASNRLQVFARQPAPVQVEYMIGHGCTSGLTAIDAFLADDALAPAGAEAVFSEQLIRLPRMPLAYRPPAAMPPVAPLPAQANGCVTFGYFGRTVRLNDNVVATWSRILHAVPGSRLVLNSAPLAEPAGQDGFAARFAAHGIAGERLRLIFTTPQPRTWEAYGAIDIALDPFPHNAGTTTIEALWQGVPVLTLAGRPTVGRFGAAILHAVGLDDWVTHDIDGYIARAVAAAADTAALAELRAGLRARLEASPLLDAPGLARAVEHAFRELWEEWRQGTVPRLRQLYAAGAQDDARELAGRMLARDPAQPDALHLLSAYAYAAGDAAGAAALLARAPPRADILSDLGVMLRVQGRLTEAEAAFRQALALDPAMVPALGNLGNVLLDQKRAAEAESVLADALAHAPDEPRLLRNMALALLARAEAQPAEALLRHALAVSPNDPEAHETLGALLGKSGRVIEAEAHHRAALPAIKDRHRCLSNLAVALQMQGRHAEAEACYREALALRPDYASGHGNLLFALSYRDDVTPEAIFAEYRRWDARHARPLAPREQLFALDRTPGRRLRIGYVSPDFRQHAAALFTEPLLQAHDRAAVELFCYAEVPVEDAATQRFRALADHWRSTVGLSDSEVAALVREDRIDVLVDLGGQLASNRLLVFARKPAPVQIEYITGHGYTSGLSAIDGFLADRVLAPPGADAVFSERLVRLPRIPLVYRPPAGMPEVAPLPARANGRVTFGYFGRPERLNDSVVATWSRILLAVPGSRLVLNNCNFLEAAFRDLFLARFAAQGVGAGQLELIFTAPQPRTWEAYGAIDIALDPFPHNAGTTTIEALWSGVPVLSLAGRPSVGRFGASILHAVGLDDWVTTDADAYVARAVAAASDLDALAALRAGLRPQFEASPLRDAPGLARWVEQAYRALWDEWCMTAEPAAPELAPVAAPPPQPAAAAVRQPPPASPPAAATRQPPPAPPPAAAAAPPEQTQERTPELELAAE
jgi:predicted O-linked N-acetylglucosamine transferase (SPINDLY family)